MSDKKIVHIFRCPGSYEAHGICYSLKSHVEGDDIPAGWYATLKEAAEAGGKRSLAPVGKNTPRKIKMMGMPVAKPTPVNTIG